MTTFRPSRSTYFMSALPCLLLGGLFLLAYIHRPDQSSLIVTTTIVVAWAFMWTYLAGMKIEITDEFIQKTILFSRTTRVKRSSMMKVEQNKNQGAYVVSISDGLNSMNISLKLYPFELLQMLAVEAKNNSA